MILRIAGAVSLGIALTALPASVTATTGNFYKSMPFSQAKSVNVVILADESGSIAQTPNALAGERQAAIEIIQAAWSPSSQIAVYGFGSAPSGRGATASEAVDELCRLTELNTSTNLTSLTRCANLIAPRTRPGEGNTDFAAALMQAQSVLNAPDPLHRVPLIFILTDGMLDVGPNSPYLPRPSTTAQGDNAAQQQLTGTILPSLRQFGAEVWPLGFGQANKKELDTFAAGGAQFNRYCAADTRAVPKLTVVPSKFTGTQETQKIEDGLLRAFAAATCGTVSPGPWQTIRPGGSVRVPVNIDPLTEFGSIVVNKGSPRVEVTYTDSDGGSISDNPANSGRTSLHSEAYALGTGGSLSTQEALHLQNPVPGQWTVTFTNTSPIPQTVGVSVVWQGQVEPEIKFVPQIGDSGKPLTIQVEPAIYSSPVPAQDLARLTVSVTVQWAGSSAPISEIPKLDRANGYFVAKVLVPSGRSGVAVVTATVQEPGAQGTRVAKLSYQPGGGLSVDLNFPTGKRVSPGGSLTETATVNNLGLPGTSIEFSLADLGNGVDAQIAPSGPVKIGSGRKTVPVTISFGTHSRPGQTRGTIQWRVVNSGIENTAAYLNLDVAPAPAPLYEKWWPWTVLAVLVAGIFSLRHLRKRQRVSKVIRDERQRRRHNQDLSDIGLALIRRGDLSAGGPVLHWHGQGTKEERYVDVRWFAVERRHSPVLQETTQLSMGLLRLTRDPENGDYLVACPGAEAPVPTAAGPVAAGPGATETTQVEAERAAAERREVRWKRPDVPFAPPAAADLADCLLVLVTDSKTRYYTPPVSRDTRPRIEPSHRLTRSEPFKVNKFRPGDGSADKQGGA